jgi:alpha-beta hydrolase superfamily lysophospholipase
MFRKMSKLRIYAFGAALLFGLAGNWVTWSEVQAAGSTEAPLNPRNSPKQVKVKPSHRGPDHLIFKDESYDFELRRALSYTLTGGADINECLDTARRIKEGDEESWYAKWRALGDRIRGIGEDCLAKGHRVSAQEAFLRASNYYRTAEFYLHGNPHDPRILATWRQSRETFRQAAQLIGHPVEAVRIPYKSSALPGYICRPDNSRAPRKTLIVQTGFDGTAEELYLEVAIFALRRGYNVLIFEGPGQGGALREQHLYFRPDWEKVVTPVVDFAMTRPELDSRRLALMGISMGGYLAPRAAAFEPRLAALIANTGVYDLAEGKIPGKTTAARKQGQEAMVKELQQVNLELRHKMKEDPGFRWSVDHGMFAFGKKSPGEFVLALADYNLREVAPLIKCPTLVVDSDDDQFVPGQARQLFEALRCSKTFMSFTRKDMASMHCQMGALAISNQRILDWLDEHLAMVGRQKRPSPLKRERPSDSGG